MLLGSLRSFCFACFSFCFGFCAEGFEAAFFGFADGADCFVVGLEPLCDDGGEQAAVLVFLLFGAFFGVVEVDGEEFLGAGEVYVVVEGDEGVGGVFSVVHVDDGQAGCGAGEEGGGCPACDCASVADVGVGVFGGGAEDEGSDFCVGAVFGVYVAVDGASVAVEGSCG